MVIIGWLATKAEDPESNELIIHSTNGTEENLVDDILTTAINSDRGAAANTVGALIYENAERVPFFIPYLKQMVCDPTITVRAMVAKALICLYRHDDDSAVDLFLDLTDIEADELFATHYVDKFLFYANMRHFDSSV